MTEVLFYQLLAKRVEDVLPELLEKSLARGWRAVVQGGSGVHIEALDAALWTYRDESFLPHASKANGEGEEQPVSLTDGDDNPNDASVRFLIDGATIENASSYQRLIYIFDGHDMDALEHARARWKIEKKAGHDVTYWKQNEMGRWEKKA